MLGLLIDGADLADAGPAPSQDEAVRDARICALVGGEAWSGLPPAIRARFAKRLDGGACVTYVGTIVENRRNWLGKCLAEAGRLIGAPLPRFGDVAVPAAVTITEDAASGGQIWTRVYGRARGFPQVIHSSKRFSGPTGLEEYLGRGFGIALNVRADARALHFLSAHYFVAIGRFRLVLPGWLAPGALTISHEERPHGAFVFVLSLRHRVFGELVRQSVIFRERFTGAIEGDQP